MALLFADDFDDICAYRVSVASVPEVEELGPKLLELEDAAPNVPSKNFMLRGLPFELSCTQPVFPCVSIVQVFGPSVTSKTLMPFLRLSLICFSCDGETGCQSLLLQTYTRMASMETVGIPTAAKLVTCLDIPD